MPRLLVVTLVAGLAGSCAREDPPPAPVEVAEPTAAHGDHNPRYGGVVMMKGDLHYEVVLDPSGRHRVYFSDAARSELPASTASRVTMTIIRKDAQPEPLTLDIDETGESWVGQGQPVKEPEKTTARLAYTVNGESYWIDLPFTPEPADPSAPDPHKKP
jgi:hypothetical protein